MVKVVDERNWWGESGRPESSLALVPEAGEVELVRRRLLRLTRQTLRTATSEDGYPDFGHLIGERVIGARRHGKLLALDFSAEKMVFIHLRMTGGLDVSDGATDVVGARVVLWFEDLTLTFTDLRRLGTFEPRSSARLGDGYGVDLINCSDNQLRRAG